eukprot:3752873-Prymnesium_polylepis.2
MCPFKPQNLAITAWRGGVGVRRRLRTYLQCPHHGARNFMKAAFPLRNTTSSKLLGVNSTAADAPSDATIASMISANLM